MTLLALNLYTDPASVYDWLGTEGVQLRLDDHNQATGQTISVTAAAAVGAVTLNITALSSPLLTGSILEFDGGGLAAVVEVQTTAVANLGATTLTVAPLPTALPVAAQAYDNGVNLALAQRLVKGCQYGTSRVKLYCCSRYDDSMLQTCWSANRWATIAAAKWICERRAQGCPAVIQKEWEEALDELRQVNCGMLRIEDIPLRSSGWPWMSNVTLQLGYDFAKVRVEPMLSEATPVLYPQFVDWSSILSLEW